MTTEDKIRKRIKMLEMIHKDDITEIKITRQEAKELEHRSNIDGVSLITVEELNDDTKIDCFAYNGLKGHCTGLNHTYCRNKNCKFYNNKLNKFKIERDIREYIVKHKEE